jgi:hypothetical protein
VSLEPIERLGDIRIQIDRNLSGYSVHTAPSFLLLRRGMVEFSSYDATDEPADARALSAESVQLGLGPLGELHHHAFQFRGRHLLSMTAYASMLSITSNDGKLA